MKPLRSYSLPTLFMPVSRILVILAVAFPALAEESAEHLWSLRPLTNPVPPRIADRPDAVGIDAFIVRALGREGLKAAPPATRQALIRRASYDLTGLPPEPVAVAAFVNDTQDDAEAFAKVVDELLASPHYGERWGRHWMDVVRYADTAGENSDHPVEDAWRYRNWVIDAFNADKPYDQFVREQLAGDILSEGKGAAEVSQGVIATGYLAIARRFGHKIEESMHLTYEDAIDNLGKAFLGLSISCARCHDHKHDPITTLDYYALYGVLSSTRFPYPGCEPSQQPRDLVPIASQELLDQRAAWEKRRAEFAKSAPSEAEIIEQSKRLKALAAGKARTLAEGEIPDGGSSGVAPEGLQVSLRKGEALQLSILPLSNYGADTTVVELEIRKGQGDKAQRWSVADLMDHLAEANPNAQSSGEWCFLDTKDGEMGFLSRRSLAVDGKEPLQNWSAAGKPPSVLVNQSEVPVKAWTSLPPRTFFMHPGPDGPVAIAWMSPVAGEVSISLKVADGHPGGPDGVGWRLEHLADPQVAAAFRDLGALNMRRVEVAAPEAGPDAGGPPEQVAYAVVEGEPGNVRLQLRGEPEDLGDEVPRRFLSALGGDPLGDGSSSGRLELARHITSVDNPLTARVMVNRIWAWHFGRGLVSTPNDFGNHGVPPSHPELLDFLARRFIDGGWSIKAMHRLMMNSETYRQSSGEGAPEASYAGFARRRLSAEELRDTLLVTAGLLDRAPGEGHPFPPSEKWGFTQHTPFAADYATSKRSVYTMRKRNRATAFFALFDGPDPNASTARRGLTTVPTQALYFLNDPFFHDCANQFAALVRAIEPDRRVDFVCRQLFARPATAADHKDFKAFAAALVPTLATDPEDQDTELWRSYARILLSSNEFLFLD